MDKAERFSISKLFKGLKFWEGESMGKIIFIIIISSFVIAISLGLYHKITQRTTSTTIGNVEAGGKVIVNEPLKERLWETNLNIGYGEFDDNPIWLGWGGFKKKW